MAIFKNMYLYKYNNVCNNRMYYIRIIVGIYHKILLLMSFIITVTKCTGLKKKKVGLK